MLRRIRRRRQESEPVAWRDGASAALSLTFDDGDVSQLTEGVEVLQRVDVRATFFVLPHNARRNRKRWRAMAELGHEIGNHSTSHVCGSGAMRTRRVVLDDLTLDDIEADLADASRQLLEALDVAPRSFAYPCGQTFVGRGLGAQSYIPVVARMFDVGRTFNDRWPNDPRHCDLAKVACLNSDGRTLDDLRPWLEDTVARSGWLVLGGHAIGRDGGQATSPETIEAVVSWWRSAGGRVDTIGAIGAAVKEMQTNQDVGAPTDSTPSAVDR